MTNQTNNITIGLLGPIETAAFHEILSPPSNLPYSKGLGGSPFNLLARELHQRGYNLILYTLDPAVETEMTIEDEWLTMIGDGSDKNKLEQLAKSLGIEEQVTFAGYQPNASAFMANHRFYVHAAKVESMGIVLL